MLVAIKTMKKRMAVKLEDFPEWKDLDVLNNESAVGESEKGTPTGEEKQERVIWLTMLGLF